MSLNKGESGETQLENNIVEKPKRGCGAFVKKWWWAIAIVLAIGALVIILPL